MSTENSKSQGIFRIGTYTSLAFDTVRFCAIIMDFLKGLIKKFAAKIKHYVPGWGGYQRPPGMIRTIVSVKVSAKVLF